MKDKIIGGLQKFSKAMISSVLYLPIIGLLLVICSLPINANIVKVLPFLDHEFIYLPFKVLYDAVLSIISNLGPVFAIGIAFGLAKRKKEHAALVAFMSLFVYLSGQQSFLKLTGRLAEETGGTTGQAMMLGFQGINAGVFIGIIIGVIVGIVHNKYCEKDLGEVFSIYGGTKFVFGVCMICMLVLAIGMCYIWPPIQRGINYIADFIANSGNVGIFVYGFLDRILIPTGLHQILESTILFTDLGGTATVAGQTVSGARNIALAQVVDPGTLRLSASTVFNHVNISKVFGLMGAGIAMMQCATKQNRKKAKGVYLPAMMASAIASVTEPLEFTFLFVSPVLFVFHAVMTGAAMVATNLLGVRCCSSGALLDLLFYNIPAGVAKTGWPLYIVVGLVQMLIYYLFFRWYILKFNVKTPGRDDNDDVNLITKAEYEKRKKSVKEESATPKEHSDLEIGKMICEGVGGAENIVSIDNCYTRLRIELKNMDQINDNLLKMTGSKGIVKRGKETQIIYGTQVFAFRKMLEDYLEHENITI